MKQSNCNANPINSVMTSNFPREIWNYNTDANSILCNVKHFISENS